MPVAFAYAEMSAAFERFAAAELESVDDEQIEIDLETHGAQLHRSQRPPQR